MNDALFAAANAGNLAATIICGEIHIIGHGPELIEFRHIAIKSGARYLGSFNVTSSYVDSTGHGVNGIDTVARFAFAN